MPCAVRHQAHCRWYLGLQGVRQGAGWRRLRAEVSWGGVEEYKHKQGDYSV